MSVPISKLVRLEERGREPRNEPDARAGSERGPLPALGAAGEAAEPAGSAPREAPPALSPPALSREAGLSSALRHLSLVGWLRWVHTNRSDATLRVRSEEGSGSIWCRAGAIIDAEWEGRSGEDALRELLPRSSGVVTLDFAPVQRPCRVTAPTPELLQAAVSGAQGATEPRPPASSPPALTSPGPAPKDRFTELALLLAESVAPVENGAEAPPPPARSWARRGGYLASVVVIAALAVAGFAVGRLRAATGHARTSASELAAARSAAAPLPAVSVASVAPAAMPPAAMPPAAMSPAAMSPAAVPPEPPALASPPAPPPLVTPRPRELPTLPFVALEVEPAHAEIWLDGEVAGRGALQLAPIRDGMLHELRFTAPGYEAKAVFFRDAPPAGRVLLRGLGAPGAPAPKAEAPRRATRPRARAAADVPAPKPAADRSPRIELIEVRTPRVQVLD